MESFHSNQKYALVEKRGSEKYRRSFFYESVRNPDQSQEENYSG
jgi:hypothetical protein